MIYCTCNSPTRFRHLYTYAHHQDLETILVLLPHMVCNVLVAGGRRSGAGQQAMHPGWEKLLEQPHVHTTRSVPLIPLHLVNLIMLFEQYESWSSLLCNFLQCPLTFSSSGQDTFLSTVYFNTLSLYSSINAIDEVLRPSKATGGFSVLPFKLSYNKETCKKCNKTNVCTAWIRHSFEVLWFLWQWCFTWSAISRCLQ